MALAYVVRKQLTSDGTNVTRTAGINKYYKPPGTEINGKIVTTIVLEYIEHITLYFHNI